MIYDYDQGNELGPGPKPKLNNDDREETTQKVSKKERELDYKGTDYSAIVFAIDQIADGGEELRALILGTRIGGGRAGGPKDMPPIPGGNN
ncbi:unnamed protein product [Strongylus vulgaris]|uniref:Uncharacterized protein n=1 Tax=Strongylus vulgaris TaxID=40348 RepID=A0A3P7J045_STRVU|nr:unnamed protein product [Strongylus vulgaris]